MKLSIFDAIGIRLMTAGLALTTIILWLLISIIRFFVWAWFFLLSWGIADSDIKELWNEFYDKLKYRG